MIKMNLLNTKKQKKYKWSKLHTSYELEHTSLGFRNLWIKSAALVNPLKKRRRKDLWIISFISDVMGTFLLQKLEFPDFV